MSSHPKRTGQPRMDGVPVQGALFTELARPHIEAVPVSQIDLDFAAYNRRRAIEPLPGQIALDRHPCTVHSYACKGGPCMNLDCDGTGDMHECAECYGVLST